MQNIIERKKGQELRCCQSARRPPERGKGRREGGVPAGVLIGRDLMGRSLTSLAGTQRSEWITSQDGHECSLWDMMNVIIHVVFSLSRTDEDMRRLKRGLFWSRKFLSSVKRDILLACKAL